MRLKMEEPQFKVLKFIFRGKDSQWCHEKKEGDGRTVKIEANRKRKEEKQYERQRD